MLEASGLIGIKTALASKTILPEISVGIGWSNGTTAAFVASEKGTGQESSVYANDGETQGYCYREVNLG